MSTYTYGYAKFLGLCFFPSSLPSFLPCRPGSLSFPISFPSSLPVLLPSLCSSSLACVLMSVLHSLLPFWGSCLAARSAHVAGSEFRRTASTARGLFAFGAGENTRTTGKPEPSPETPLHALFPKPLHLFSSGLDCLMTIWPAMSTNGCRWHA